MTLESNVYLQFVSSGEGDHCQTDQETKRRRRPSSQVPSQQLGLKDGGLQLLRMALLEMQWDPDRGTIYRAPVVHL